MGWNTRLTNALQERQQAILLRERQLLTSPQDIEVTCDGRTLLNFCSNDYLGLASEGGKALARAAQHWQLGSGASHLVCGHSQAHHDLEETLAQHTGYPRALLFSTGYMANVGAISALAQRGDRILQDKLNHASLLDGAILSRATLKRYRHQDISHLSGILQQEHTTGDTLIVSDSIFSMDGDLADVRALSQQAQQHEALLMIDDAHGFGVLGKQGAGVREAAQLSSDELPVYVGTLGKALGGYGAFVAGSDDLIEYLIQFARPYIYTTALPPALADAMLHNLELIKDDRRRERLHYNIRYFRQQAETLQLPLMASDSAIQPLLIGDTEQAMQLSQQLKERGLWISAIRPPTVPQGSARLRITLTSEHETSHIDTLLNALAELWSQT